MKNYVIINGVNSNTITGLMINELPPITKPQMRAIQEEIDGRDGDITTNLGYSAYDKTITIGLFGTGYDIDDIVAFFNGEGTIVFSNEDDKYYNFKILNQIDYVALQKFKSASITFHCQPFKYPLTETPLEIEYSYVSDEGETISLNTAPGLMKVNLLGNTSQTGTPTPSTPIDVNVVSGDNEVVVSNSDGTQSSTYPIHLGTYELCKIGTYQDKFIRNSGKQLWQGNKDYTGQGTVAQIHQTLAPGTYTASYKQSVNGTVQFNLKDSNGSVVQAITTYAVAGNSTATFTITSNEVSDIWLYLSVNMTVNDIMLNEGSTALPYEPYGNGDWYLEKKIGKYTFGSEIINWTSGGQVGNNYYFYTDQFDGIYKEGTFYCDKLKTNVNASENDNVIRITSSWANIRIYISTNLIENTTTSLNNWLATNKPTIYSPLLSPTYTKIEGTLKDELDEVYRAYSFEGTTNISQVNNDKAFILNVVAMEEGSNEIQVNNIGNTYAKPLIALEGTGNINIYLDNTQILQANVEDKMNIDIAKLEAYNPDTSVLLNRQVIGNYNSMTIPSGTSIIRMDGELTKATITNYTRWL